MTLIRSVRMDLKRSSALAPQDEDKENQPKHDILKKEAKKRGLSFVSLPVSPGQVTDDNINQFSKEFN